MNIYLRKNHIAVRDNIAVGHSRRRESRVEIQRISVLHEFFLNRERGIDIHELIRRVGELLNRIRVFNRHRQGIARHRLGEIVQLERGKRLRGLNFGLRLDSHRDLHLFLSYTFFLFYMIASMQRGKGS